MSDYSPEAEALLNQWMIEVNSVYGQGSTFTVILPLRSGLEMKDDALYREIGREMRTMMSADGIQKSFPEDEPDILMRRFVDFRISEEAIPSMSVHMDRLNDLVINLLITLCTVHIPNE